MPILHVSNAEEDDVVIVDDVDYEWAGKIHWHLTPLKGRRSKYVATNVRTDLTTCGRTIRHLHRYVAVRAGLLLNTRDPRQVDHVNWDGLDNRRSNLRVATGAQQTTNKRKFRTYDGVAPTSRYKGTYWAKDRNMWRAYVSAAGQRIWLGQHHTEEAAAMAYDNAAAVLHGEYAVLNFSSRQ